MSGGCEFFAERLRRLRKKRGYTQAIMGERLGVSYHAIGRWERAYDAPDRNRIPDLARLLGVSTDYLLTGRENAHIAALHHAIRSGATQQALLAMIGADNG